MSVLRHIRSYWYLSSSRQFVIVSVVAAVDPCNLPRYCTSGFSVPSPVNCSQFLTCFHGQQWVVESCSFDPNDNVLYQFDRILLTCTRPTGPDQCQKACPVYTSTATTVAPTTMPPGEQSDGVSLFLLKCFLLTLLIRH